MGEMNKVPVWMDYTFIT